MEAQTTTAPVLSEEDLVKLAVAVGILPDVPAPGPTDLPPHLIDTPDTHVVYDVRSGALVRRPAYARTVAA